MLQWIQLDASLIWVMAAMTITIRWAVEFYPMVLYITLVNHGVDKQVIGGVIRNPLLRFLLSLIASLPTFIGATMVYMVQAYNLFILAWLVLSITRSIKVLVECIGCEDEDVAHYPQDSHPFMKLRMVLLTLGLVVNLT